MSISLYDAGWRQGSLVGVRLQTQTYRVVDGVASVQGVPHAPWVIASQDCDLHSSLAAENDAAVIELRAVDEGESALGWGIRSRELRLSDEHFVQASAPRLMVTPSVLSLAEPGDYPPLEPGRALAFKTWLGLRYDRPAVPDHLVGLARAIGHEVKATKKQPLADQTHDVLISMTEGSAHTEFTLVAVVTDAVDRDAVQEWLVRAALRVDSSLGVMGGPPEIVTKSELTLEELENSYSADLSNITYSKAEPRGV